MATETRTISSHGLGCRTPFEHKASSACTAAASDAEHAGASRDTSIAVRHRCCTGGSIGQDLLIPRPQSPPPPPMAPMPSEAAGGWCCRWSSSTRMSCSSSAQQDGATATPQSSVHICE